MIQVLVQLEANENNVSSGILLYRAWMGVRNGKIGASGPPEVNRFTILTRLI